MTTALEQLKALTEGAKKEFHEKEKALLSALADAKAKAEALFKEELKKLHIEYAGIVNIKKSTTATTRKPRSRSLSDDDIKGLLEPILSKGPAKFPEIATATKLSRIRFDKFVKANPSYITSTGVRKTKTYSKV